jgi:cAMP-dependent protein kinase regulator/CRP/FNR family cyclic AMP-dependent transcriptional regulator/cGMP-dependent protein kinase 2
MKAEDLRSVPLFERLDDDALRELSVWLNEVMVEDGKHLVDEGDYAYDLFVIVGGTAEVTREGEQLASLGPGDFFGEMGVLSEEGRRNATVVARTPMRLLTLATYDVDRMKKTAPEMLDRLTSTIEERSRGS